MKSCYPVKLNATRSLMIAPVFSLCFSVEVFSIKQILRWKGGFIQTVDINITIYTSLNGCPELLHLKDELHSSVHVLHDLLWLHQSGVEVEVTVAVEDCLFDALAGVFR